MRGPRELKGRRYKDGQGQLGEAAGDNYKAFRGLLTISHQILQALAIRRVSPSCCRRVQGLRQRSRT